MDKIQYFAAGVLAAFAIVLAHSVGGLSEKSQILKFGGFTEWGVKYKCERTDQK